MKLRITTVCLACLALLLSLFPAFPAHAQAGDQPWLPADLTRQLRELPADAQVPVIVHLRGQGQVLESQLPDSFADRTAAVAETMRMAAETAQRPLLAWLEQPAQAGRASAVRPLWIVNAVALHANRALIEALAERADVAAIEFDRQILAPNAEQAEPSAAATLRQIHVQDVWSMGLRGQGIVVAVLDTGVDAAHPDLASAYRGGAGSWFDPYGQHPTPFDPVGHGTWVTGVMVGQNGTGVAPEARWIAAKIFDDDGLATVSAIHAAYQWVLDPDGNPKTPDSPQVVNNSWGFQYAGCDLTFQPDLRALRAAGILPIFAAGNIGPQPQTSTSPANYPEAFSVGAVDGWDSAYTGSSRGTTTCGGTERAFPRLSAPGVQISTTALGSGYTTATGTSLAAPHTAGVLALLLSARPGLALAEQEQALLAGVRDLGEQGTDNTYGAGRIDALASLRSLGIDLTSQPDRYSLFLPLAAR